MRETPRKRTIQLLWLCHQGTNCTNLERPGTHEEYNDCAACLGIRKPVKALTPPPILVMGRRLPVSVAEDLPSAA